MTDLLIDAIALGDDSAYRGIGTYLRELVAGLAARPELEVTALCRPGVELPPTIRPLRMHRVAPGRWRRFEHELLLPLDLHRARPDVFHSPALDPPWGSPSPWVHTLHDVIPLVFDDPALASERRRWRRQAGRFRKASAIVAVSRYTADVGISVLNLDPRRVEVIPHGVGSHFQPPAEANASRQDLLLVSEYSRRKGYQEAFAVMGDLAQRGYPERLRVAGRIAPWLRSVVDSVVAASPAPDRVELLGFVDPLAYYQRAKVLVMSSRYEGFGFPVLEAMACGTPVVAFDNSSLTEVVGDAGILVPDGDVPEMARAIRSLLDDQERWREFGPRPRAGQRVYLGGERAGPRGALQHGRSQRVALSSDPPSRRALRARGQTPPRKTGLTSRGRRCWPFAIARRR